MRLWLSVFEFLLNQAVWENANLLSGGELNSYTSIHQIFIECPPHARPRRKREEGRNKTRTLSSRSVQTDPRSSDTYQVHVPQHRHTCYGNRLIGADTGRVALRGDIRSASQKIQIYPVEKKGGHARQGEQKEDSTHKRRETSGAWLDYTGVLGAIWGADRIKDRQDFSRFYPIGRSFSSFVSKSQNSSWIVLPGGPACRTDERRKSLNGAAGLGWERHPFPSDPTEA